MRRDVTEVGEERRLCRLVVHLAGDDLELDEQALLVGDDLRLPRLNFELPGGGGRGVVEHAHAQGKRDDRLHGAGGQGIVAVDGTGQEILELQIRHRTHGDGVGHDLDDLVATTAGISDGRPDEVEPAGGKFVAVVVARGTG